MKVDVFTAVTLVFLIGVCLTAIDFKSLFSVEETREVAALEVNG